MQLQEPLAMGNAELCGALSSRSLRNSSKRIMAREICFTNAFWQTSTHWRVRIPEPAIIQDRVLPGAVVKNDLF